MIFGTNLNFLNFLQVFPRRNSLKTKQAAQFDRKKVLSGSWRLSCVRGALLDVAGLAGSDGKGTERVDASITVGRSRGAERQVTRRESKKHFA